MIRHGPSRGEGRAAPIVNGGAWSQAGKKKKKKKQEKTQVLPRRWSSQRTGGRTAALRGGKGFGRTAAPERSEANSKTWNGIAKRNVEKPSTQQDLKGETTMKPVETQK